MTSRLPRGLAALLIALVGIGVGARGVAAQTAAQRADLKAIHDYKLSMDVVHDWADATVEFAALSKTHPDLVAKMQAQANAQKDPTIDQLAAEFEQVPEIKAILRRHHLDARHYFMVAFALPMAVASAQAADSGADPSVISNRVVSAENIQFARDHKAEIAKLIAGVTAKTQGAGGGE